MYPMIFQECLKKHGTVLITANGQEVNVVSAADCDDDDDNDYITNFQNKFSTKKVVRPTPDPVCTSNMWAVRESDQSHVSTDEAINPSGSGIGSTFRWRLYLFIYAEYREIACAMDILKDNNYIKSEISFTQDSTRPIRTWQSLPRFQYFIRIHQHFRRCSTWTDKRNSDPTHLLHTLVQRETQKRKSVHSSEITLLQLKYDQFTLLTLSHTNFLAN
jgi:hypothetical protein